MAAAPFVDLPGADAAKTGKAGLADVGRGQKRDEFGVLERPHGPSYRTQLHPEAMPDLSGFDGATIYL